MWERRGQSRGGDVMLLWVWGAYSSSAASFSPILLKTLCLGQWVWPWRDWERMNPSLPPIKNSLKTWFSRGQEIEGVRAGIFLQLGAPWGTPSSSFAVAAPSVMVKNLGAKTEYPSQKKPTQQVLCPALHQSHPQSLAHLWMERLHHWKFYSDCHLQLTSQNACKSGGKQRQ